MASEPLSLALPDEAPFRCAVSRDHDSARILPVGALDISTVPTLEAEIDAIRSAGYRHLIIDLTGLDFIDSTGLRSLIECDADARRDGFTVTLVRGPAAVHRIFELTGTRIRFRFVDS